MRGRLVALGFALTITCSVAHAEGADRSDRQLLDEVMSAVMQYTQFTVFDHVEVDVNDGSVTLTGEVTMAHKREDLERRVEKIDGVREIRNRITVLPASLADDRLRYQIARAIYDSPHFSGYAIGPNPPIHIIVEHGRVTLTGVVNNDTDRMIARSLARQFPGLSVTDRLKTVAEAREQRDAVK